MKLLILILLCSSVSIAYRMKREELSSQEKASALEGINTARRNMASHGIANVNKLRWSDDLHLSNRNCHYDLGDNIINKEEVIMRIFFQAAQNLLQDPESLFRNTEGTILNCLNPIQRAVRCMTIDCTINNSQMEIPYCICGPEYGFKREDIVPGPAGSKCPGRVEDGLCVLD
uniref:SCP domain-containing protein n=1 Tax=Caenorhabditis tropicalis TaxID=1561998 RepID=A0A1I7UZ13_9PELO